MSVRERRLARISGGHWAELRPGQESTSERSQDVIRIAASDLQEAQAATARIRAHASSEGTRPAVFLDILYHVADDARTARREASEFTSPSRSGSVRYVGTRTGLRGLIDDITAADVADGVTLLPLNPHENGFVLEAM
ncbi:hypothetical protein [Rhodococcus sp. P1Y]|uniref:hypothetical protein n=1 Tax=Rhodococcus sp. P1Y TaxID=1302308 RepID=UPI0012939AD4|nr:hypothetical protein [Rhodococcus sp. P1Y]